MTAQILRFPTRKPKRENKATVAKRLIPQILGPLMTKGVDGAAGARFFGNGLDIWAASPPDGSGVVTFGCVGFDGKDVLRFGVYSNGETYVTYQRRGAWETAVSDLNAPNIDPADLAKHWIKGTA